MLFSARIGQTDLANLCRRLAIALSSGVDIRRVFTREAEGRTRPALRKKLDEISFKLKQGSSLSEAVNATGEYFPPIFREMVNVGEQTGHSAEVFKNLADHYENQVRLRRMFLSSITWPIIQLTAALSVIGLLIWFIGWMNLKDLRGKPIDVLGLGLIGADGLKAYLGGIAVVAFCFYLLMQAVRRGVFWTRPLQYAVLAVPKLGRAMETLALARLAWSLNLTFGSGMDLLRAMPLCLRTMQNARYSDHCDEVVRSLRRGQEVSEVLAATRAFPADFLDAVEVGERSGRLPETMANLSEQYQDEAQRALAVLTTIAGFLVWAIVACIIIFMIFRLFTIFYLNPLRDAMKM